MLPLYNVCCEVNREAKCVIQAENRFAGDDVLPLLFEGGDLVVENAQAVVEGLDEAFLLVFNHFSHIVKPLFQLRVGVHHQFHNETACFE